MLKVLLKEEHSCERIIAPEQIVRVLLAASMYLEQTPATPSVVVQVLLMLRLVKLHLPVL
jgi:hypothetical protein